MSAQSKLGSIVIEEDELTGERLLSAIKEVQSLDKKSGVKSNPTQDIVNLIIGK